MNTIPLAPSKVITPNGLFFGPSEQTKYLWKNLILEKRIATGWISKFFKGSIFGAFWMVVTSSVD